MTLDDPTNSSSSHIASIDVVDYLANIHTSSIDLGLDRISTVCQKANLTKPAPKVITVAGTNGKAPHALY
ncbi:dihydrofolate synthase / Folylpolyglutamate synthase [Vibrio astriarenae]|nr:dihydrofolate synthase / Folylpolyglutamate synthase [Vibrio sp. C7]